MKNRLSWSHYVLIGLLPFILFVYRLSMGKYEAIADLSLNLASEIIGILLTVFLIEAAIRRNHAEERLQFQKTALTQLRLPLLHHLQFLINLYKASVRSCPRTLPTTFDELFTPEYFEHIKNLDFSKPAPIANNLNLQWMDYVKSHAEKLKDSLSRTLDRYLTVLDQDNVALIEETINSSIMPFLNGLVSVREWDRNNGFRRDYLFFAGDGVIVLIEEHVARFVKLLTLYNSLVEKDKQIIIRSDYFAYNVAPLYGSAR